MRTVIGALIVLLSSVVVGNATGQESKKQGDAQYFEFIRAAWKKANDAHKKTPPASPDAKPLEVKTEVVLGAYGGLVAEVRPMQSPLPDNFEQRFMEVTKLRIAYLKAGNLLDELRSELENHEKSVEHWRTVADAEIKSSKEREELDAIRAKLESIIKRQPNAPVAVRARAMLSVANQDFAQPPAFYMPDAQPKPAVYPATPFPKAPVIYPKNSGQPPTVPDHLVPRGSYQPAPKFVPTPAAPAPSP
jgi:hypothetical protein